MQPRFVVRPADCVRDEGDRDHGARVEHVAVAQPYTKGVVTSQCRHEPARIGSRVCNPNATLTSFGLAFLIGFSTDVFFQALDRLVNYCSQAVGQSAA